MKTSLISILGMAAFLFAVAPAVQAADQPDTPAPAANWLIVQNSTGLKFDGKSITLEGVSPQTILFTDRPERMSATMPTEIFVKDWTAGKDSFEVDPPNASLSTVVDGKENTSVVELTNPRLDGTNLTYDVRILEGTPPNAGTNSALFIDWWYGPWGGVCNYRYWRGVRCHHPYWY